MTFRNVLPAFDGSVMRVYSQHGEEGVLLRILLSIGHASPGYAVEFGARDGIAGSNTALLRECGWDGLMMDEAYENERVRRERVTRENVCQLFEKYSVPKEPDIISIDVDGNDLWIASAILEGDYRPRIMIVEFNSTKPPDRSLSIPYNPNFRWDNTDYYGATLEALRRTLGRLGQDLVCQLADENAFFMRHDLITGVLPVVTYEQRSYPPDTHHRPWVEIP